MPDSKADGCPGAVRRLDADRFLDIGSRNAIDQALSRMTSAGEIRRITRGLYDLPRPNSLTGNRPIPIRGGSSTRWCDETRRACWSTGDSRERPWADGCGAGQDLGPHRRAPASDQLGAQTITFKLTAPSRLHWAGRPAMRVVQALQWLRSTIDSDRDRIRRRLAAILADPEHGAAIAADLREGFTSLPDWMQTFLRPLLDEAQSSSSRDKSNKAAEREAQMNQAFITFLSAAAVDRRDAFLGAAQRLGAPEQNIEKDFWVCWTLDALFNGAKAGGPRLLFKGGTSLSKAFGLISRFSEDIDITIFREDLGEAATVDDLEALSGKKRRRAARCHQRGEPGLCERDDALDVADRLRSALERGLEAGAAVEPDPDAERDGWSPIRTIRTGKVSDRYPKVTAADEGYVRPAVKIESGAKSALDPNQPVIVKPYVADVLADLELSAPDIRTVVAERTFWDKVVILHGLRQWFDARGALRGGGQRISRHYYDVYRLLDSDVGRAASGRSCAWRGLRAARPHVLQQSGPEPRDRGARLLHALAKRRNGH